MLYIDIASADYLVSESAIPSLVCEMCKDCLQFAPHRHASVYVVQVYYSMTPVCADAMVLEERL